MKKLKKPYIFDWHRIRYEDSWHIEYSITDICNRNCRSCSHLAPLAFAPEFVSEEEFTRVCKILRRLLPDTHTFWLTGGEPTLHPVFLRLLEIACGIFENSYIGIFTNGIMLKKFAAYDKLWEFTARNNIVWAVTPYDIGAEYFRELFTEKNCENNLTIVQGGKIFTKLVNYSQGKSVSHEKYLRCGWERCKINVRGGKIYNCPSSEFSDLFAAYFGKQLTLTESDYLTVDENLTRERIEKFRGPMPFCSQCDISRRFKDIFMNSPSERNIGEWSDL